MSLSFPSIWVPGSSFILASCLTGKEAISSLLLDQWDYPWNLRGQTKLLNKNNRNIKVKYYESFIHYNYLISIFFHCTMSVQFYDSARYFMLISTPTFLKLLVFQQIALQI